MTKNKYDDTETYILKPDEFALQFISQKRADLFHIENVFKQFGLNIRREIIIIKMRLYTSNGISFNKRQMLKIISVRELEYALDLMRGDFERQNLTAKDYERYNAIERTIKACKVSMAQNAPKNDHFYHFD